MNFFRDESVETRGSVSTVMIWTEIAKFLFNLRDSIFLRADSTITALKILLKAHKSWLEPDTYKSAKISNAT